MNNCNNNYLISPISTKNDFTTNYTSPILAQEDNLTKNITIFMNKLIIRKISSKMNTITTTGMKNYIE